jgi:hypothetical protein
MHHFRKMVLFKNWLFSTYTKSSIFVINEKWGLKK